MLAAVLVALVIGTLAAFGGSFSGRVEREAIAAAAIPTNPAVAPTAKRSAVKDEPYVPMSRKTASLLFFSVLRSGSH